MNEKTPIIKFSHAYSKLLGTTIIEQPSIDKYKTKGTLLEVLSVDLENLSSSFIAYDTDLGKFSLPKKGKYLMLIFLKSQDRREESKNLFTTLRRLTPEKEVYYRNLRGKEFIIDVASGRQGIF